mmetsp:Transcript_63804/g.152157  ORF Transcript_63804/g.152157 Transcript_63804/m.152157 type:complete len:246 (+) Transcript_63804:67-804(+)
MFAKGWYLLWSYAVWLSAAREDPQRMVQLPWEGEAMPDEMQPQVPPHASLKPTLSSHRSRNLAMVKAVTPESRPPPQMPGAEPESALTDRSSAVVMPMGDRRELSGALPTVDHAGRIVVAETRSEDRMQSLPHDGRQIALRESASSAALSPGPSKMQAQCEEFATWMKDEGIKGAHRVNMWKATCGQLVAAGGASQRYKLMCDTLSQAVGGLEGHVHEDDPVATCKVVLRIFADSGIGASPVEEN